jgi:hypothetical protein
MSAYIAIFAGVYRENMQAGLNPPNKNSLKNNKILQGLKAV